MNELATTGSVELSAEESALELHKEIVYNYRMAAVHLVDAAKGLKRMRDTKAYVALGLDSFEEYTEKMAGIKARQAYTYISTLERLGTPMMEERAELGITKLSLLAEITPVERDEFADSHDLAGMTVKEIEALVAEKNRLGEQLAMFEEEREEREGKIEDLRAEIERLENIPPAPVASVLPDEETMQKIREEAAEQARADAMRDMQVQVDAAVKDALATVKQKQDKDKAKMNEAKEAADAAKTQLEELKAQRENERALAAEQAAAYREEIESLRAKVQNAAQSVSYSDNNAVQEFAIRFENVQREFERMMDLIDAIEQEDAEMAAKSARALQKLLWQMDEKCDKKQ